MNVKLKIEEYVSSIRREGRLPSDCWEEALDLYIEDEEWALRRPEWEVVSEVYNLICQLKDCNL